MILIVNTTIRDRVLLGLIKNGKLIDRYNEIVNYRQAEKLLIIVDKLLRAHKLKVKNLHGVVVVVGPGGFSSVRLGIILANTLGYSLDIPVVGLVATDFENLEKLAKSGFRKIKNKKSFNMAQPFYGGEPNITKPKKLKV
jgi:tRNA A37 threonylcarbamoyladenosine modification protein TsaB